ncbi:XRE family transcriptional regulator [Parapedobacter deserti]|uniref:XRE family transcriptional regulator n=1 Tax=Parapedobacter deserti TaxID=1912957 RepID=A0ABV7JJJ3_9SPHI
MTEIYQTKAIFRIEYELILNVKSFRDDRGWSQEVLSGKMGFTETFVGKCESLDQPEKYNLRHIGLLKKVFGFKSLDDLFPNGMPKDEQIVILYKKVPKKKADGSDSKIMENVVVEIVVVDGETKAEVNKQIKSKSRRL